MAAAEALEAMPATAALEIGWEGEECGGALVVCAGAVVLVVADVDVVDGACCRVVDCRVWVVWGIIAGVVVVEEEEGVALEDVVATVEDREAGVEEKMLVGLEEGAKEEWLNAAADEAGCRKVAKKELASEFNAETMLLGRAPSRTESAFCVAVVADTCRSS